MGLTATQTAKIIKDYGANTDDSGSSAVQIALLTERLKMLNEHFKSHNHDHHSKRGLLKLVGQRKRLLRYLNQRNPSAYKELIQRLGLRR